MFDYEPFDMTKLPDEPETLPDLTALWALRDCGVIRVRMDADRFIDLHDEGLADLVRTAGDYVDYRLSVAGRRYLGVK